MNVKMESAQQTKLGFILSTTLTQPGGTGDWVAELIEIKANTASQESWSWGLAELVVVIVIVDVVVYVLAVVLIIIAVHIMFGCDQ